MNYFKLFTKISVLGFLFAGLSFAQTGPLPYADIAVPLSDTLDQMVRDSVNLKMSKFRVNQSGYRSDMVKYFYFVGTPSGTPTIIDVRTGQPAAAGTASWTGNVNGSVSSSINITASNWAGLVPGGDTRYTMSGTGPSGALTEGVLEGIPDGKYKLVLGTDTSADFSVHINVYGQVRDALLKFYGVQRSGANADSWFHPPSHLLDEVNGGWYDCGDHLKEGLTMSFALAVLGVTAAALPNSDEDNYGRNHNTTIATDGIPDMLAELKYGAEFVIESYRQNGNQVPGMVTSMGDFGMDHNWWGRPEQQDGTIPVRGGPPRPSRSEMGANVMGRNAAGMAFLSRLYRTYDPALADEALEIARKLYDHGKLNMTASSSGAYNGESATYDDMALAAVALAWAHEGTPEGVTYFNELFFSTAIGNKGTMFRGSFPGGWFAFDNAIPDRGSVGSNTGWARVEFYAFWGAYKLLLQPSQVAAWGITEQQRSGLVEDILYAMSFNLAAHTGDRTITIPATDAAWVQSGRISYTSNWYISPYVNRDWIWNRYVAGNTTELFTYWDIAKDVNGYQVGGSPASTNWNDDGVLPILVRQLDYFLGVNEWDLSFVYGVGDKNPNHPHHRGSNPEGRNTPGAMYDYRPPVGGFHGGWPAGTGLFDEYWDDYYHSEICLDATTTLLLPVVGMAAMFDVNRPPQVNVRIEYVGNDEAIITIDLDKFGSAEIRYGTTSGVATNSVASTENGTVHRLRLTGLSPGTQYYFDVLATDARGNSQAYIDNPAEGLFYTFTTTQQINGAAIIENIIVCNLTSDSAEITWYTPNGNYDSKVYIGTSPGLANMTLATDVDAAGVPVKFHYTRFGGLEEQTTYYYAVESGGTIRDKDDEGNFLTFTTPIEHFDFDILTYDYLWGGLPMLVVNIMNNEPQGFDSLEARIYFRGPEADVMNIMAMADICFPYDPAGFQLPGCHSEMNAKLRNARPIRLDDTYSAGDGYYDYYLPLQFEGVWMHPGSRIRFDIRLQQRMPNGDESGQPPAHFPGSVDWSFRPHSRAAGDPVDFAGITFNGNQAGGDMFWQRGVHDANDYITIYRKNQFIYGFSPSYTEQAQRMAKYELSVEFDDPWNVPNGTYIEYDGTAPSITVRGTAHVTEAGYITRILANGVEVPNLGTAAVYDFATGLYNLTIPVPVSLEGNLVDITIFAGPDPACAECQQGSCAFVNRNFYLDYSRGNFTQSRLFLLDPAGTPLAVEQDPSTTTEFKVKIIDANAKDNPSAVEVMVYNPRRGDTIMVSLAALNGNGEFESSLIQALQTSASNTGAGEIAFYPGDTVYVRYQDADDEYDISQASFYAELLVSVANAYLIDSDCNGIADGLNAELTAELGSGISLDKIILTVKDDFTSTTDSFTISSSQITTTGMNLQADFSARSSIPETTGPYGTAYFFFIINGNPEPPVQLVYEEKIEPKLTGVTLLENLDAGTENDTLRISFSESVNLSNTASWPLDMEGVDPATLVVLSATSINQGRAWQYVTAPSTQLDGGRQASIASGFVVRDLVGNELGALCGNPEVTVVKVPKPVDVNFAIIKDFEGDGLVDEIRVEFARKLRPQDVLDSFMVRWGIPGVARAAKKPWSTSDSTTWFLPVSGLFDYAKTSGDGTNGAGKLMPRLGPLGGFFDRQYDLYDSAGPVIVQAIFYKGESFDSLQVINSEPLLESGDASTIYLQRRRGSVTDFIPQIATRRNDSIWTYYYTPEDQGAIKTGDFVRFSIDNSKFTDRAGNKPGPENPWVEVRGAISTDVEFDFSMLNKQYYVKPSAERVASAYDGLPPADKDHFRISVVNPGATSAANYEMLFAGGSGSVKPLGSGVYLDSNTYKHVGPTFLATITLPNVHILGVDEFLNSDYIWTYSIQYEMQVFDNLGQFVNSIKSEPLVLDDNLRSLANREGAVVMQVEWMLHNETAPKSKSGRLAGSGAYIARFDVNVTAEVNFNTGDPSNKDSDFFMKGEKFKDSKVETLLFGFMRP
jgi:hypothetical protein